VLFDTVQDLVFLPVVVGATWALLARFRPVFPVAASHHFYASWSPPFSFLVVGPS